MNKTICRMGLRVLVCGVLVGGAVSVPRNAEAISIFELHNADSMSSAEMVPAESSEQSESVQLIRRRISCGPLGWPLLLFMCAALQFSAGCGKRRRNPERRN